MFWTKRNDDKILLERLQAEVVYLREQNAKFADRLLAVFDSKAYVEIKQHETREADQKIQVARVERMTSEDFHAEVKMAEDRLAKERVLNMQFSTMNGNEAM